MDTCLNEIVRNYIRQKYKKSGNIFLGIPHRLDRPTSGIVVFAKTSKSLKRFNELLRNHFVRKIYWAVVNKKPSKNKNTLSGWLKKNPKSNKSFCFDYEIKGSKKAILSYSLIRSFNGMNLLEIDMQTGRHHQIRCQLANIGLPIKGDVKYGDIDNDYTIGGNSYIYLHSRKISFLHPIKNIPIDIIGPLPKDKVWNGFK